MKKAIYQHLRLFGIGLLSTTLIVFSGCNTSQKKQNSGIPEEGEDIPLEARIVALGDAYDIIDFHRMALENGPMPMEILEQVIDAAIADRI